MPKLSVVFVGPAGSGKTLLTWAFGRWLERELEIAVDYVNLDPSVESLSYEPSFDSRALVRARDVVEREGLGPNAAIVRAVEVLAEREEELREALEKLRGDCLLVDTPGQMEILLFRPSGVKLFRAVREVSSPIGVFLLDSTLGTRGASAAISILLATVTQLRLEVPVVPVLSKADAAGIRGGPVSPSLHLEVDEVVKRLSESGLGALSEMLSEAMGVAKRYLKSGRLIAVSSVTGEGLEDLYKVLHEIFCACGDLT